MCPSLCNRSSWLFYLLCDDRKLVGCVGILPLFCFFQVSVDSLSWEFHVSTLDDSNITDPPKVQFSLLYKLHTHTHTHIHTHSVMILAPLQ